MRLSEYNPTHDFVIIEMEQGDLVLFRQFVKDLLLASTYGVLEFPGAEEEEEIMPLAERLAPPAIQSLEFEAIEPTNQATLKLSMPGDAWTKLFHLLRVFGKDCDLWLDERFPPSWKSAEEFDRVYVQFSRLIADHILHRQRLVPNTGSRRSCDPSQAWHAGDDRIAELDRIIAARPEDASAFYQRGSLKHVNGNLLAALTDLDRAIALCPHQADFFVERAVVRKSLGRLEDALSDLTTASRLCPGIAGPYNLGGLVHLEKGDPSVAWKYFSQAIALEPAKCSLYNNRGVANIRLGDLDAAIVDFQQALQLDSSQTIVRQNLLDSHLKRAIEHRTDGDYVRSIADFTAALELDPNQAGALSCRGQDKGRMGDLTGALADFDRAIELDPSSVAHLVNRAGLRAHKGDSSGALADFDRAIALNPSHAIPYNNRGVLKAKLGDFAGAVADYRHALRLDPTLKVAMANLQGDLPRMLGLDEVTIVTK